jgi:hypothetical protein
MAMAAFGGPFTSEAAQPKWHITLEAVIIGSPEKTSQGHSMP